MLTKRQSRRPQASTWLIVSHLQDHDGKAMYVGRDTKGSVWGGAPHWTYEPKEARAFRSRQAAHQFLKRLDHYDGELTTINLGAYGYPF